MVVKRLSLARIYFHILSHLRWVIFMHDINLEGNLTWDGICHLLLSLSPQIHCASVIWYKSEFGWCKINYDGSSLENEMIRVGEIIINHRGIC